MNSKTALMATVFFATITAAPTGGYGTEHKPSLEIERKSSWVEVTGEIINISADPAIIEIKTYLDPEKTVYTQETVYVTKEARVIKNGHPVPLKALDPADRITVRYLIGADGRRQAYKIWVEDH